MRSTNPLKWFRRAAKPEKTQHVYTDTAGVRYYTYRIPTDVAMSRAVAAEHALRFAEFGVNRKNFKEKIEDAKKCLQTGDAFRLAQIIHELDLSSEAIAEQDALLDVSACLVLQDGEPAQYDPLIAAEKTARWRKSSVDRDFFLELAWASSNQFKHHSSIDILNYLRQTASIQSNIGPMLKRQVASLRKSTSPHLSSPGVQSLTNKPSSGSQQETITRSYKLPLS